MSIDTEEGYHSDLFFKNGKLLLCSRTAEGLSENQFCENYFFNGWTHIGLVFQAKSVSFYINGKLSDQIKNISFPVNKNLTIKIMDSLSNSTKKGVGCQIGPFYFLNTTNIQGLFAPDDPEKLTDVEIINCFHPAKVAHGKVFDYLNPNVEAIFWGNCLTDCKTIFELTDGPAFSSILSVLKRFLNTKVNQEIPAQYVQSVILSIIQFFINIFQREPSKQKHFSNVNGFNLLFNYFIQMDNSYLPDTILEYLKAFQQNTSDEIRHQVISNFLLNLNFLVKLPASVQKKYCDDFSLEAFQSLFSNLNIIPAIHNFFGQAVLLNPKSPSNTSSLWHAFVKFFQDSNDYSFFLKKFGLLKNDFAINILLDHCFSLVKSCDKQFFSNLLEYDYYYPFLYVFPAANHQNQLDIISFCVLLKAMRKKLPKAKSSVSFQSASLVIFNLLKDSPSSQDFLNIIFQNGDCSPGFFHLVLYLGIKAPAETQKLIYVWAIDRMRNFPKKITKVAYWYVWFFEFCFNYFPNQNFLDEIFPAFNAVFVEDLVQMNHVKGVCQYLLIQSNLFKSNIRKFQKNLFLNVLRAPRSVTSSLLSFFQNFFYFLFMFFFFPLSDEAVDVHPTSGSIYYAPKLASQAFKLQFYVQIENSFWDDVDIAIALFNSPIPEVPFQMNFSKTYSLSSTICLSYVGYYLNKFRVNIVPNNFKLFSKLLKKTPLHQSLTCVQILFFHTRHFCITNFPTYFNRYMNYYNDPYSSKRFVLFNFENELVAHLQEISDEFVDLPKKFMNGFYSYFAYEFKYESNISETTQIDPIKAIQGVFSNSYQKMVSSDPEIAFLAQPDLSLSSSSSVNDLKALSSSTHSYDSTTHTSSKK